MLQDIKTSNIQTDGLFLNADTGFDISNFLIFCSNNEIIANIADNKRNGLGNKDCIFDEYYTKRDL
jgi:hypothetical protein